MKNSLHLLPVLLLSAVCTLAQAQTTPAGKSMAHAKHKGGMGHEYCVMKDGKMMMMHGGKMMPMTKDMTMSDGTVCMADGTCKMKDGTTMKMSDGQCMMMDGKMTTMDAMKKGGKMKHSGKMDHMKM